MDIVERLRGYCDKREIPAWGEIQEAADEIERLHADLRIAGDKFAEVCDENERLRKQLMRAYQFVSPLSDPMPITNREMADEIMRCLEQNVRTE